MSADGGRGSLDTELNFMTPTHLSVNPTVMELVDLSYSCVNFIHRVIKHNFLLFEHLLGFSAWHECLVKKISLVI